ncbi:MAG: cytochrome C [Opitutae bacterium]|nr:cytochrome C [Opitutae bacterium]
MKAPITLLGLAGILVFGVTASLTLLPAQAASVAPSPEAQLERGRYLVLRTGLCTDCHSPRNERGELIESRQLMGAPIPFAPTVPMPWMPVAPRLAGLPAGFNEEQMIHFLMTGERPNGRGQPLPPMPPFRFDHDDATAIAAFLRSLPAK